MAEAWRRRVGRPFIIEAVRMLEAGEGTPASIDEAMGSAGYTIGPFRRLEAEGLDVELALERALHEEALGSTRFEPPALIERLVSEGHTGWPSSLGGDGDPATTDRSRLAPAVIVERIELATINEAYRVAEEGLVSPLEVDRVMREDEGWPYGPFERAGQIGLRTVIGRLRALHVETEGRSGDQFIVATSLWQLATV